MNLQNLQKETDQLSKSTFDLKLIALLIVLMLALFSTNASASINEQLSLYNIEDQGTDCFNKAEIFYNMESNNLCIEAGENWDCQDVSIHSTEEGREIFETYQQMIEVCNLEN
jgi:spermidine/putrescine-binding protein